MTSVSFIKHLKQVTPAEREDELTKKISVSKDIIAKLLELVKNAEKKNKDLVQQLNEGGITCVRKGFELVGIVFYKGFVLFPSVGKLGNIFVRNIVSYQCFVLFPSVGKPASIFVRNIVS